MIPLRQAASELDEENFCIRILANEDIPAQQEKLCSTKLMSIFRCDKDGSRLRGFLGALLADEKPSCGSDKWISELQHLKALAEPSAAEASQLKLKEAHAFFTSASGDAKLHKCIWAMTLGTAMLQDATRLLDAYEADAKFAQELPKLRAKAQEVTDGAASLQCNSAKLAVATVRTYLKRVAGFMKEVAMLKANCSEHFHQKNRQTFDEFNQVGLNGRDSVLVALSSFFWGIIVEALALIQASLKQNGDMSSIGAHFRSTNLMAALKKPLDEDLVVAMMGTETSAAYLKHVEKRCEFKDALEKVVPVLCKKCKKLDLADPALTCFVSLTSQVLEHLDEPQRSPHGSDVQWLSGMDRASKETASAASSALSAFLVAMGKEAAEHLQGKLADPAVKLVAASMSAGAQLSEWKAEMLSDFKSADTSGSLVGMQDEICRFATVYEKALHLAVQGSVQVEASTGCETFALTVQQIRFVVPFGRMLRNALDLEAALVDFKGGAFEPLEASEHIRDLARLAAQCKKLKQDDVPVSMCGADEEDAISVKVASLVNELMEKLSEAPGSVMQQCGLLVARIVKDEFAEILKDPDVNAITTYLDTVSVISQADKQILLKHTQAKAAKRLYRKWLKYGKVQGAIEQAGQVLGGASPTPSDIFDEEGVAEIIGQVKVAVAVNMAIRAALKELGPDQDRKDLVAVSKNEIQKLGVTLPCKVSMLLDTSSTATK